MSALEDFVRCVNETEVDGRVSIECKLGLWSVESADSDRVYLDAFHYWRQYHDDGEYYQILGGESPSQKLMNKV